LLAARPGRVGRRAAVVKRRGPGGGALGLADEELLLAESQEALQFSDASLEENFALAGALMHGLVKVGLLAEGDGLEAMRTRVVRGVARQRSQRGCASWGKRGRVGDEGSGRAEGKGKAGHSRSMTGTQL
jgi:hypothetical protein